MLDNLVTAVQSIIDATQVNAHFLLLQLAGIWGIHIYNRILGYRLNYMGIYPRKLPGLLGIAFAPFLHGNFGHLLLNSVPLFILSSLVLTAGIQAFYYVSGVIIILSGLATWLLGRPAIHIGSSGLVMGYFGYLLFNAYYQASTTAIILAIVGCYYFGGLLLTIFPTEKYISWESHLFGFLAGGAAAYAYPFVFYTNNAALTLLM